MVYHFSRLGRRPKKMTRRGKNLVGRAAEKLCAQCVVRAAAGEEEILQRMLTRNPGKTAYALLLRWQSPRSRS